VSLFETYRAPPLNAKEGLEQTTRALWEKAYAARPNEVEDLTRAVLKNKVSDSPSFIFCWTNLSIPELQILRDSLIGTSPEPSTS
jgi:hypothetical protein